MEKLESTNSQYTLGPVKTWVSDAANYLGKMFNIKTIYGYSKSGSVPGSLHPKGRAIDLMTSAMTAAGKKKGDELAAYAIANASALGVTEVIWNRRIATKARGWEWRPYNGPRSHTDHVHLSFADSPGTGLTGLGSAVSGAVSSVAGGGASSFDEARCGWKLDMPIKGPVCVFTKVQVRQFGSIMLGGSAATLFVVGLIVLAAYGLKQSGALSAAKASAKVLPLGRVAGVAGKVTSGRSDVPTVTNPGEGM